MKTVIVPHLPFIARSLGIWEERMGGFNTSRGHQNLRVLKSYVTNDITFARNPPKSSHIL